MGFKGHRVSDGLRHQHHHHFYHHNHQDSFNSDGSSALKKGVMEQQIMAPEDTICFCHKFLNPLGNYLGSGLLSSSLQHFCRVCNIQLNSCRQAKIHSEGKKHEKRLSYLRMCMESTGELTTSMAGSYQTTLPPTTIVATTPSLVPTAMSAQPPVHHSSQVPINLPPPQLPTSNGAAIYTYQHGVAFSGANGPQTTTAYYYPPTTYQSVPPQQHSIYTTCYPDYMTTSLQPPQLPLQALQTMQSPPNLPPTVPTSSLMRVIPPPSLILQNTNFAMNGQQQNAVLSPSLTSGFSGSGDCKSTETSSILSVASYSSVGALTTAVQEPGFGTKKNFPGYGLDHQGNYAYSNNYFHNVQPYCAGMSNQSVQANSSSHGYSGSLSQHQTMSFYCDVCQAAFPTALVLENHTKGSRHARKLKSQQAFRQLKESGTHFRHDDGPVGEIRCEVCQVSVNSSQQLQAHLTGHKHKVRAVRRGVKPNQALLYPSSSTPSALSDHSFNSISKGSSGKEISQSGSKFVSSATVAAANETPSHRGTTLVRHQSSGCLSRHCQSTLSLSRTKSGSTALNKVRSRSMNLLMVQPDAASSCSSSSDDGYVDERRGSLSLKRRALNLVNGRPRSLSVRTSSITKEDEQGPYKDLASSKPDPASATAKTQGYENDKIYENKNSRRNQKTLDQQMNKQNLGFNPNTSTNHATKPISNKLSRTIVPPSKSDWKPRRTSLGNGLKDVPMLDVFLERLKPAYGKSTNNSNIKNKQHEAKEETTTK